MCKDVPAKITSSISFTWKPRSRDLPRTRAQFWDRLSSRGRLSSWHLVLASNLTLVSSLSLASTFPLGLASLLSRTAPSRQEDSLSSLREPWRPSLRLQLILCKLVCLKKHETPGCDWNSFFIFVLPKRGLCFFFR